MTRLLPLLLIAQTMNLNTQPIEVRQSGTRLTTKRAWAVDCQDNMTCIYDAGVVILKSTGGGATGKVGEAYMADASITAAQLAADPSDCTAGQYATTIAANGNLTCAQVTTAQLSGTITNAQLASSYSGVGACGANTWASTLNDNAAPTCTQPGFSNLSGSASTAQLPTVPVTKGGTNLTTIAANQVWVGTAADTVAAKTVPSCSNATTSKLLYDNATQTWSCGTDQTSGGGGGLSYAEIQRRVSIGGP